MNMAVFWIVASCSLVEVYKYFRGPYCLHHQGVQKTNFNPKTVVFKLNCQSYTAMKRKDSRVVDRCL
jgi:hypothetical protein